MNRALDIDNEIEAQRDKVTCSRSPSKWPKLIALPAAFGSPLLSTAARDLPAPGDRALFVIAELQHAPYCSKHLT